MPIDPYSVLPLQPSNRNGNDYDAGFRQPNNTRYTGNNANQYNGNQYSGDNGNSYSNNYDPNQQRNFQAALPPFEGSGNYMCFLLS